MQPFSDQRTLYVLGTEPEIEEWLLKATPDLLEQAAGILKIDGPYLLEPFDELMRSVLLAVYHPTHPVRRIRVIGAAHPDGSLPAFHRSEHHTLEYLAPYAGPLQMSDRWNAFVQGSRASNHPVHETVEQLRKHPLLPVELHISGSVIHIGRGVVEDVCV